MPGAKNTKKEIAPDPIYNNVMISQIINHIMKKGKKNAAKKIVYGALDIMKEKTGKDPVEVFNLALENARPLLEVKSQRIGGATYQVPRPVVKERGTALAVRWLLESARKKEGPADERKACRRTDQCCQQHGCRRQKKRRTRTVWPRQTARSHTSNSKNVPDAKGVPTL